MSGDHPFTADLFERIDDSDDALFYREPRKVVHLDLGAIEAVRRFFGEILAPAGRVLDLMASWRSHLPPGSRRRVVGLGMNADEMAENPDLHDSLVHDLNRELMLPFRDEAFDAVLNTVSVQYLTRPIDVFREVRRVLRPAGSVVIVMSDRCFPTKAVRVWQRCANMRERMELGMAYLSYAGGFAEIAGVDLRPARAPSEDPVVAVVARRPTDASGGHLRPGGWRRR